MERIYRQLEDLLFNDYPVVFKNFDLKKVYKKGGRYFGVDIDESVYELTEKEEDYRTISYDASIFIYNF